MPGFKIAQPNEALIVAGKRGRGETGTEQAQQYNIVPSGKRVFVWPVIQSARTLRLDLKQLVTEVKCYTQQGVPVVIKGVVAFKVGSDNLAIANAVQRFLHDPDSMEKRVDEIFAGHIRGIVGGLTVEQLIRDRDALTKEARDATQKDMDKMGLGIDTLQIAEVDDPSGYIENLSKPDIARVQSESRIAQAQREREAAEREQENAALVASARRDSEIKQAELKAQIDRAQAEAAQAGPLAEAEAQKAVVERSTEVAKLRAAQREQELVAEIEKPAEADRRKTEINAEAAKVATIRQAEAHADAARMTGEADAAADRARGLAQADVRKAEGDAEGSALEARARGLAKESDAVIAQQIADRLPDTVRAAAAAFEHIDTFTVLNGADGVMEAVASLVATGRSVIDAATKPTGNGNGGASR